MSTLHYGQWPPQELLGFEVIQADGTIESGGSGLVTAVNIVASVYILELATRIRSTTGEGVGMQATPMELPRVPVASYAGGPVASLTMWDFQTALPVIDTRFTVTFYKR